MSKRKTYPENLLSDIHFNERFHADLDYKELTEDQLDGLEYFLSTAGGWAKELFLYYRDGVSVQKISEEFGLREGTILHGIERGLKRLQGQTWSLYVTEGYRWRKEYVRQQLEKEEKLYCEHRGIIDQSHIYYSDIHCLNLSVRCFHCLDRENIRTVRELVIRVLYAGWHNRIRNLGAITAAEITAELQKEGLLPDNYRDLMWAEEMPFADRQLLTFQKLNAVF